MLYKRLNDIYSENKNIIIPLFNSNFEKIDIENNCFDCGCRNPELISVNNGILICNKCGINHMTFPPGTSILINKESKIISKKEFEFIKYGGNKRLYEFILEYCPSLIYLPRNLLYISPLLNIYRKRLFDIVNRDRNKMKIFQSNLSNLKIKEGERNYNLTHRTTNSNINIKYELNCLTEEIQSDKKLLKKLNIIYNKPKLKNAINKLKIEKKESKEIVKTSRNILSNKLFSTYFDNMNKIYNTSNNNIRNSTPIKKIVIPFKSISNRQYSSKTIKHENRKDLFMNKFNIKDIKINKRKISVGERDLTKSEKAKNIKYDRKIKEIIINKNLNKNSAFANNIYQFNTKTFLDQRRPIQVNLSLQNTNDNSQNNNINNINNCLTESDFNETPTIIIHNTNKNIEEKKNIDNTDSKSPRKYEKILKYNINNIHINLNKNLKKKNKKGEGESKIKIARNLSENKIKSININFQKKINNELMNNGEDSLNKPIIKKTNYTIKTNKDKDLYNESKDQKTEKVSQSQILPIKIFKKINPKQIKNKKIHSNKQNNIYNNKKENSILYKNLRDKNNIFKKKRKIISPKRNETNSENDSESFIKKEFLNVKERENCKILCNSYKKMNELMNVETFKNSIRNKYKREKSKKE